MFNLQVLPHRGKELEYQLKYLHDHLIITHQPLYSSIRENPFKPLKEVSMTNKINLIRLNLIARVKEPFLMSDLSFMPKLQIRTIQESLELVTETIEYADSYSFNWQQQNDRYKALLLLKITE